MTKSTRELRKSGVSESVMAVREWREAHKVSMKAFAAMVGVSVFHLSQAELGYRPMSIELYGRVQAAMAKYEGRVAP